METKYASAAAKGVMLGVLIAVLLPAALAEYKAKADCPSEWNLLPQYQDTNVVSQVNGKWYDLQYRAIPMADDVCDNVCELHNPDGLKPGVSCEGVLIKKSRRCFEPNGMGLFTAGQPSRNINTCQCGPGAPGGDYFKTALECPDPRPQQPGYPTCGGTAASSFCCSNVRCSNNIDECTRITAIDCSNPLYGGPGYTCIKDADPAKGAYCAKELAGLPEACNGLDDDGDGQIDEGSVCCGNSAVETAASHPVNRDSPDEQCDATHGAQGQCSSGKVCDMKNVSQGDADDARCVCDAVPGSGGSCITAAASASNKIIDCNDRTIGGASKGIGLTISGANNLTIKDCTLSSWNVGVNLTSGSDIRLQDCSVCGNVAYDIFNAVMGALTGTNVKCAGAKCQGISFTCQSC